MINKIAAGEVVERPASVVKELVENSIDADAKRIEVIVEQGGMNLIRVIDDGVGMLPEQLLQAISPHATSKITDTDDLFNINTFGFRGEALASIAEISQLSVKSRTADQDKGAEITCNGGERSQPTVCGLPSGTQIEVKNLFFNTPARRKYMKTVTTELGHISETFVRLAIPHPNIHFVLRHNDRIVFDLPNDGEILSRLQIIFGEDVTRGLVHIEGLSKGNIRVNGYVSPPAQNRLNNKLQYLFLNSRFIKDRSLQHALSEAYRGLLTVGRFPIAFLNITMPTDQFDVNVHPTKLEVRFIDTNRVYSGLLGAVREKFLKTDLTERADIDSMENHQTNNTPANNPDQTTRQYNNDDPQSALDASITDARRRDALNNNLNLQNIKPDENIDHNFTNQTNINSSAQFDRNNKFAQTNNHQNNTNYSVTGAGLSNDFGGVHPLAKEQFSDISISSGTFSSLDNRANRSGADVGAGANSGVDVSDYVVAKKPLSERVAYSPSGRIAVQFHDRYLVLETADGVAVIDQHALHERVLYEQMKERMGDLLGAKRLESQLLLVPVTVDLSPTELAVVLENRELLLDVGVKVDLFGGETVIIASFPTILANIPPQDILLSLIEMLLERTGKPDRVALLDDILHSMACKAAVKAGDKLNANAIAKLIELAEQEVNTHHCPHGRPSSIIFTCEELDKRFRR
jgi:DNA mismatch repair protein MutL